jgi:hypothetical protein
MKKVAVLRKILVEVKGVQAVVYERLEVPED